MMYYMSITKEVNRIDLLKMSSRIFIDYIFNFISNACVNLRLNFCFS
jgi:hypothetical protein